MTAPVRHPEKAHRPDNPSPRKPEWIRVKAPTSAEADDVRRLMRQKNLHTVCEEAACPNIGECWKQRHASFMILGDICTRGCRFCSVQKGKPLPVDPDEPRRVAEAARELGLEHVVITCVTRDDLPDGGAEHFCQTVTEIRRATKATVEVLPSDFGGNAAAVDRLVEVAPEVYNHNTETVPRLYLAVRGPKPDYAWTLEMFRRIRGGNPTIALKTGLMLGLGETTDELLQTLAELFEAGCRMLTLGQYLQPSPAQLSVVRYLPPEEFDELGRLARQIGFEHVASGPFVRSSYHAGKMLNEAR